MGQRPYSSAMDHEAKCKRMLAEYDRRYRLMVWQSRVREAVFGVSAERLKARRRLRQSLEAYREALEKASGGSPD